MIALPSVLIICASKLSGKNNLKENKLMSKDNEKTKKDAEEKSEATDADEADRKNRKVKKGKLKTN